MASRRQALSVQVRHSRVFSGCEGTLETQPPCSPLQSSSRPSNTGHVTPVLVIYQHQQRTTPRVARDMQCLPTSVRRGSPYPAAASRCCPMSTGVCGRACGERWPIWRGRGGATLHFCRKFNFFQCNTQAKIR